MGYVVAQGSGTGSSPLARGLHARQGGVPPDPGIIPARAGFTWSIPRPPAPTTDHPRSRGVYGRIHCDALFGAGSSPLARGLPGADGFFVPPRRIIPARAGFTVRPAAGRCCRQDHPRSRGVYVHAQARRIGRLGSSPLARGLLSRSPSAGATIRIIPARAGFTASPCWYEDSQSDHPRSRGVYAAASAVRRPG